MPEEPSNWIDQEPGRVVVYPTATHWPETLTTRLAKALRTAGFTSAQAERCHMLMDAWSVTMEREAVLPSFDQIMMALNSVSSVFYLGADELPPEPGG